MKAAAGERSVADPPRDQGLRTRLGLDRFAVPSWLVVVVAVAVVALGQIAEDLADSPPLQLAPPSVSPSRWTVIALAWYMVVIAVVVDETVKRSIPALDRIIRVDARTFRSFVARMRPPDTRVNVVLLTASALIVTVLFVAGGFSLPIDDQGTGGSVYLPADRLSAFVILAGYTTLGWAGLSLVFLVIRVGHALGELCKLPLDIDVFDTTNLLPFGNIALASALAPAGVIVIGVLGLGEPQTWLGWTVLLLAAASGLLALLLPLRGIHRQMADAKEAALAKLNARLSHVYDQVTAGGIDATQKAGLDVRANTLIPLRRTANEMTTWPFADSVAFGRAVLIASAPLIYTVLNELIKIFWIAPLSGN